LQYTSRVTAHYEEWPIAPPLRSLVACGWAARFSDAGEPHVERVIPDGCVDLIYVDGSLVIAGPDTTSVLLEPAPATQFAGLRFRPGLAPAVLGVPASALVDQRVEADAVLGARARVLVDELEAAPSARARGAVLESHVQRWARRLDGPDRLVCAAVQRLRTESRDESIARLAAELGVSERQLRRRFVQAVGYGPKLFERVMRLQRFVACAARAQSSTGTSSTGTSSTGTSSTATSSTGTSSTGTSSTATSVVRTRASLAELALSAGYADQPHLTRECRALAGVTPNVLLGYPVTAS
jgi:AraC-like DNA-binding protein